MCPMRSTESSLAGGMRKDSGSMRPITYTANNHITLLHCGAEFFPALIAACDAAVGEIYLETYIFAIDPTADEVKAALQRAAARGVSVNVITDWLGTGRASSNQLHKEFSKSGVHHRSIKPKNKHKKTKTQHKKNNNNQQLAFLGGLNINDDMISD